MTAPRVVPVTGFSGRLLNGPSPVETRERDEIAAVWRRAVAGKPKMFDGRVLLGETVEIRGGVLEVAFRDAAFSTLVWLRAEPQRAPPLFNVFGAAVVVSADGAALLGMMAAHTANAGQLYFPCGTPDRDDVRGDAVDVEGSILRELAEETGLAGPLLDRTERAIAVMDGPLVGYLRRFDCALDAAALRERALAHLRADADAELDDAVLARAGADLGASAPAYVHAALSALLAPQRIPG